MVIIIIIMVTWKNISDKTDYNFYIFTFYIFKLINKTTLTSTLFNFRIRPGNHGFVRSGSLCEWIYIQEFSWYIFQTYPWFWWYFLHNPQIQLFSKKYKFVDLLLFDTKFLFSKKTYVSQVEENNCL